MTKLQEDIKTKKKLKDISESSWDKIIFVDKKKLTERGYLLAEVLMDALLNDDNPKLVLLAENKKGHIRIANQQAANDLLKVLGTQTFIGASGYPFTIERHWNTGYITKQNFAVELTRSRKAEDVNTNNYTFINESLNINIYTMRADNDFFTFIKSNDGSGFKRAKVKSLEVFQFLKKYADDNFEFEVIYPKGETFDEGEVQVPGKNPIATPGNPPTNNLIEIQLPLKDIPSKYWDRVEVGNDWDREYVEAENDKSLSWEGSRAVPMTFSHGIDGVKRPSMNPSEIAPWNRKFKSQKTLDNFKKYVDVNKEIKHYFDKPYNEGGKSASFAIRDLTIDTWFTTHLPSQLTKFLKDDNKLFIKDGYGKVTSQEAFEFLQSIIKSKEIKVAVKLTQNEIDLLNSPLNKGNRRNYVIRLKKGAKIIESLKKFAMDCEIGLAQFSMIGSVEDINVVFSLGRGKGTAGYHHVPMPISTEGDVLKEKVSAGQMELLTSWGNITWGYSEPFTPHVHCHASLADYEELKVFGGHLKEATVSITAEIIVEILSEKKVLKKLDEVDTEVNLWDFDKDAISFLSDQTGIKRLMKDEDLRKKVLLTTSEQKVIDKWKNYDFTIFPYKLKDDRWITLLFNGKKPNWVFIYAPFSNDGTDNIKAGIIIAEAIEFTKKIGLDTNDNYCFRHAFTNLGDDKTTSEVYVSAVVERLLPLLKNSPELFNDTKLMEINWDIWQGHRVKVESTRLDELKKEYENINEQKIIDNDEMSVALIQLPPKGSN